MKKTVDIAFAILMLITSIVLACLGVVKSTPLFLVVAVAFAAFAVFLLVQSIRNRAS
jgi:type II secretory pathway component PulF